MFSIDATFKYVVDFVLRLVVSLPVTTAAEQFATEFTFELQCHAANVMQML